MHYFVLADCFVLADYLLMFIHIFLPKTKNNIIIFDNVSPVYTGDLLYIKFSN